MFSKLTPYERYRKSEYGKKMRKKRDDAYKKTIEGLLGVVYHSHKQREIKKNLKVEYTRSEFKNKYRNDKLLLELFKKWEESNYQKDKKPSFDRINCFKGYTFDNLQIITWEENNKKGREESKLKKYKPVEMIKNGKTVILFNSLNFAGLYFNSSSARDYISLCCKNIRDEYKGYTFRWANV